MYVSPELPASRQGMAALRLRMGNVTQPLGFLVSAGSAQDKERLLPAIRRLAAMPHVNIFATAGTSRFLTNHNVRNQEVYRISDGKDPSFASLITGERVGMIINIMTGDAAYDQQHSDAVQIREMAVERLIYLVTDVDLALKSIGSILKPAPSAPPPSRAMSSDLWQHLLRRIEEKGGILNDHAHADKAFTISMDSFELGHSRMREKWELMDDIKRGPLYANEELDRRIRLCAQSMADQNVHTYRTFVDADATIGVRAVESVLRVSPEFEGRMKIRVGLQPLQGLFRNEKAQWAYLQAADMGVHFLGALPSRDGDRSGDHLDLVMGRAKQEGDTEVHVHTDQANDGTENESEQLARYTIKHGMEGRVTAVHCISLAAKPSAKRKEVISLMKAAGLAVSVCPSAAISMRQLKDEQWAPIHNSLAPVEELLEAEIPLSLGCDNVADIFMPLSTGDMLRELWLFAEATRIYDPEILSDVASGAMISKRAR